MNRPDWIQKSVPLASLTTLQIGGPAKYFAAIKSKEQLVDALGFADAENEPLLVIGGGSNLLVSDDGFQGLVVKIAIEGIEWFEEGEIVTVIAGAGEEWDGFVGQCVNRNLAGIECLSGIPGLVGGTPVQNVGAYGQEVSETITSVTVFDRQSGVIGELSSDDCRFRYRASIFNTYHRDRYIVLGVSYRLKRGGEPALRYPDLQNYFGDKAAKPTLKEVRLGVRAIRARKAMVITPDDPDCRSAGSFFKNPIVTKEVYEKIDAAARSKGLMKNDERVPQFGAGEGKVKVPAAWLIERAGFHKGYQRGRAGISSKHTLAIINRGGATAKEVVELVREIEGRVRDDFGVSLQPEPVFVGF